MKKLRVATCGSVLLVALAGAQALAQTAPQEREQAPAPAPEDNHLRDFKRKLIWKGPLAKTAVAAVFNEIRNSPHEWGRGIDGFGKRAGSSFGQRIVKASVELGF